MKKRNIALGILALATAGLGTAAYMAIPQVHDGAVGEAPELGRFGVYTVGTAEQDFTFEGRVTFTKLGMATGAVEREDRTVKVRLWYPADGANGARPVTYVHTMRPSDMEPFTLQFDGRAFSDVAPVSGEQFPLVIISHGFNGWNTQLSNLGEHIASHGYIVASIDHGDMPIEDVSDFVHSFSKVLVDRSLDQRQVLGALLADAAAGRGPIAKLIDPERVGLIGYSMGGYGAIATAGADYDYASDTFDTVPTAALDALRAASKEPAPLDAVIAFAPWGGQPDNRVWSAEKLGRLSIPAMIVSGSEDDVSNHAEGVHWVFEQLQGTTRHLLTYREARHNIVGNAFAIAEDAPFRIAEFLNEPVWRQDRINAINQHFVTAFLDLHLKGDAAKAAYLSVPVSNANDSRWQAQFGEQLNGKLAGDGEPEHWRGFQRRWAVGLNFETLESSQ
ncbi:alpha/beta hydrolase family protein [Altererythrobacter sp. GH1-8]|uniref:alpha/beta hydrolase family protein n=1 Tax=Altererythrobacter sp. GH1-8 TaxID=3349333 RepID=UPI00374CF4EF